MFRDVPECSGMFHVPGFIDGPTRLLCALELRYFTKKKKKAHAAEYRPMIK